MSFVGSSFNLFLDAALTSPFGGTKTLVNYTDLSDNPQTFELWLGSTLSTRQLQAASNPGVDSITLTPTDILPVWTTLTAYVVGNKIQPVSGNGFMYRCTVAGTSGVSQPTFPTSTIGSTVTDGGVTWELYAAHHPTTELKLALTSVGLASATGGAALNVATTITGGVASAVPIWLRVTNTVTTASNNTGNEEIGVNINSCVETAAV